MNKKKLIPLFFFLWCMLSAAHSQQQSVIPLPAEMNTSDGKFVFGKEIKTFVDAYPNDSVKMVLNRFGETFSNSTGIKLKESYQKKANLHLQIEPSLGKEAYKLNITPKKITISASNPAGFFYGLQTLKQLLPSRSVMAGVKDASIKQWTLPLVQISDAPRFAWRGFMLDEGRHIFGKDEIKRVLDLMASYKMNRFHWHLTEDQGWRIEIKKYPKLTSVGAWRDSKTLEWGDFKADGQRYGGFYTQDDAREIVDYARERFIEIIPEVDIPGHSQAAIAAYPELLACDTNKPHEVWLTQGVSTDVINVAAPEAVQFAKDVIDELTDIFPFPYLHLGGDECPTEEWENNEQCKATLAETGSEKYRDLQIHFYKQLKDHIASQPSDRQRNLIFWNEVLHGNTASLGNDITIMAWVGADKAAMDAAQRGMSTILSPQIPYYINRKQSTLPTEPYSQGRGTETVEAVYSYRPLKDVPSELQPKYMGVQANFWSEWVADASTLEYLMLPRLAAVAEAGWTRDDKRDWNEFKQRIQSEASYYKFLNASYGKHIFE